MTTLTRGNLHDNGEYTVVDKFGRNEALGTSYAPIAIVGIGMMGKVSATTSEAHVDFTIILKDE